MMLEVRDLHAFYGQSHILHGIDLDVDEGEIVSLLGRNGVGRSTTCKAIMGLVRASSGTVRMRGQELLGLPPASIARHHVGYVPQGRRLWRSLTVDEHLRMTQSRERGAWTAERVYDTFPRLAERRNNGGAQLSGGEQQMLAIGRALMADPKILLLDEPSLGLAPRVIEEILEKLGELNRNGLPIVLVEQKAPLALRLARRAYLMSVGSIAAEIDPRTVKSHDELANFYLG